MPMSYVPATSFISIFHVEYQKSPCRCVNIRRYHHWRAWPHITRADPEGGGGGGVLGVRTPPPLLGGPSNFIKRGKNRCRNLVVTPPPPPVSETLYPPLFSANTQRKYQVVQHCKKVIFTTFLKKTCQLAAT